MIQCTTNPDIFSIREEDNLCEIEVCSNKIWIVAVNTSSVRIFENHAGMLQLVRSWPLSFYRHGVAVTCLYKYAAKPFFQYEPTFSLPRDKYESINTVDRINALAEEALWSGNFDLMVFVAPLEINNILVKSISPPVKGRAYFYSRADLVHGNKECLEKELQHLF